MWHRVKLQTLVYDILPLEEGAGKRCSECGITCVPFDLSPLSRSILKTKQQRKTHLSLKLFKALSRSWFLVTIHLRFSVCVLHRRRVSVYVIRVVSVCVCVGGGGGGRV